MLWETILKAAAGSGLVNTSLPGNSSASCNNSSSSTVSLMPSSGSTSRWSLGTWTSSTTLQPFSSAYQEHRRIQWRGRDILSAQRYRLGDLIGLPAVGD